MNWSLDKMNEDTIIKTILKMIEDNIYIYLNNSEEYMQEIRKYNNIKKELSNLELLYLTEIVIADLINVPYLYDLRGWD